MKVFVVLFALCAVALAADDVDLTGENFQETVDNNDYVLVMFYAPWCGHCKSLKPKFAEAATETKGKYVLAKVDCTDDANKDLCSDHGVRGYPTLVFYKNGNKQEYGGPRDKEGIIKWLDKKSGPAVSALGDAEALEAFSANTPSVVFFGAEGSDAFKAFTAAANGPDVDDYQFGSVTDSALFGDNAEGSVHYYRGDIGDDLTTSDLDNLATWVFENSFPLVGEISGENYMNYAKLGQPLFMLFAEPDSLTSGNLKEALAAAAAENPNDKFGWIDAVRFKAQVKSFGCSGDVLPCLTRVDSFSRDMKPISFEEEITAESVKEFVAGVASGKYKYTPKSEPIPENNDGPVTVVVGKNFDAVVNDETKDVFVEFYAPWCGHCKKLAPIWDQLGEAFSSVDNIVVAKIDATNNDFEAHSEIRGFPTLLFYPAKNKSNPVSYSGARELKDLAAWLKDQATVEFDESTVSHDEL